MHIILSSLDAELAPIVESTAHRYVDFVDRFELADEFLNAPDLPITLESLMLAVSNGSQAAWNVHATLGIAVCEGIISVEQDARRSVYLLAAAGIFDGEDVFTGLGQGILLPENIGELFLKKGYSMKQVEEVFPTLFPGMDMEGDTHLISQLTRGLMSYPKIIESAVESAFVTYMNRDRMQ